MDKKNVMTNGQLATVFLLIATFCYVLLMGSASIAVQTVIAVLGFVILTAGLMKMMKKRQE